MSHVPCTILISVFILSLVNLSAFFLYVQVLEFGMDFFSPFTQLNSSFGCPKFMGKINKSRDRFFFMVMCTTDFYNEFHFEL